MCFLSFEQLQAADRRRYLCVSLPVYRNESRNYYSVVGKLTQSFLNKCILSKIENDSSSADVLIQVNSIIFVFCNNSFKSTLYFAVIFAFQLDNTIKPVLSHSISCVSFLIVLFSGGYFALFGAYTINESRFALFIRILQVQLVTVLKFCFKWVCKTENFSQNSSGKFST